MRNAAVGTGESRHDRQKGRQAAKSAGRQAGETGRERERERERENVETSHVAAAGQHGYTELRFPPR